MKKIVHHTSNICFITSGLIFIAFFVHGFIALASKNYMDFDQVGMYFSACIVFLLTGGMVVVIHDAFL